ncbi:hypothetical protein [Sansalvadorimonas verongulae]|uniref:hypothetical protein n=1 Tax=Sansalvadorimonas verongulae TaxID=2172824 RepID=UPI0012BC9306|nr:hypothetical protein [Sansalvadorimonas verongulae]MTI13602.1 hypothetical protein [Sansalvadorimonas verongulae]
MSFNSSTNNSSVSSPPAYSSDSGRVSFAQIFGEESRKQLHDQAVRIKDISDVDGAWQITTAQASWRGHSVKWLNHRYLKQVVTAAGKKFRTLFYLRNTFARELMAAYTNGFKTLTAQPSSAITPVVGKNTASPSEKNDDLSTPLGFRVAASLHLAGACKLRCDDSGKVGFKRTRTELDDEKVQEIDYYVNLSPLRLTYEYLSDNKSFPNGYLEHVLIPCYIDRLMSEAGMSENDARETITALRELYGLQKDRDIDLEPIMEIRNAIDKAANNHQRKVSCAGLVEGYFPAGAKAQESKSSRSVRKITVGRILDQGRATRQEVRHYFIQALRKKGEGREKARERVVAALESRGLSVGKTLSIDDFQVLSGVLGLYDESHQGDVVRDYLGLVTHIDSTKRTEPGRRKLLLSQAGMKEDDSFEVSTGHNDSLTIINPPTLEAPDPGNTYTCDYDELWCIQTRVDRGWKVRWTRDMYKRIVRWISRNKRVIAVEATSRVLTSIMTGLVSGGIAGAMYLGCAVLYVPVLIGFNLGMEKVQELWHRRKLMKYDGEGQPNHATRRKAFYESLAHVASEKSLTDCYNAYFNLKEDLAGLEKLKAKANLSAKEQIAYRRYQVIQQLRTAELGESYKDVGQMMVETVTDISRFEQAFEDQFLTLWKPFSKTEQRRAVKAGKPHMSNDEKVRIFNEAANRLLLKGEVRTSRQDQQDWMRELIVSGAKDGRRSGKLLFRDLAKLKRRHKTDLRTSAVAGRMNWMKANGYEAARHTAIVVGHFLYTNIIMNASKVLKAGTSWILKGILPKHVDVLPVPTAAIATYWVSSFLGGKAMQLINDCRNRLRVNKIIKSRRKPLIEDEPEKTSSFEYKQSKAQKIEHKVSSVLGYKKGKLGEQVAFDAEVSELGPEDYRALRREGGAQIKQIPKILAKMRKAHDRLQGDVKELTDKNAMVVDREEQLIKIAMLILERKYLEQQMQELLSGAVGTFYEETIRGEWLRRQEVYDVSYGIPEST